MTKMEPEYITDKVFDKLDGNLEPLPKAEYERCTFTGCQFQEADLKQQIFSGCTFIHCNLSLAKLNQASFRDTHFKDCKMLGLQFPNCNTFGMTFSFDHCVLDHASFYQLKLTKTRFRNCQLKDADFSESDFSNALFEQCDLTGATFDRTTLEKADFRTAFNYAINPEKNKIKKAKFSLPAVTGLLAHYDIKRK